MYQHIFDRTREQRGDRHADMARDIVVTLQAHGLPADVVMTGALYHLAQISHKSALVRISGINDVVLEHAVRLRCEGIVSNTKRPRAWTANITRFWFHVDENIVGSEVREAVQCAASISRIRHFESTARNGNGLSFLAAELIYTLKMADTPLRHAVHVAIQQAADRIGYGRNDVEARAYQLRGKIFGLYKEVYHSSPTPSKTVVMPAKWHYYVGTKAEAVKHELVLSLVPSQGSAIESHARTTPQRQAAL